jgi:hypothetical protein
VHQSRGKDLDVNHEAQNCRHRVSRRGLLSLAVIAASGAALSPRQASRNSPTPSPTLPVPTKTPSSNPEPAPLLNRDPILIKPLAATSSTTGALSHFDAAFPSLNLKTVVSLPGIGASPNSWLAVSVVGPVNQLQIVNPEIDKPVRVLTVPNSHDGGIESMVWHQKSKTLYLTTDGILMSWSPVRPEQINRIGEVPGATTLYELQLDSAGNVWGGTYPSGSTFIYSPQTKSIRAHSRFAADTDYVRRLAISSDDTVWVGTGSINPRLFSFMASQPGHRTEIQLPIPISSGFISSVDVVGNRVVVTASNISDQLLLDPVTKKWVGSIERVWASRRSSAEGIAGVPIYSISGEDLYVTDPTSWQDRKLGKVATNAPLSLQGNPYQVCVASGTPTGLQLEYFSLTRGVVETTRSISLTPGDYKIQSLLGHSDGNIYIGGYMGDGLAAVNPDTGSRWHSPNDQNLINQVEAMIEFDTEHTYIGSYGSADIIGLKILNKDNADGYSRLERLSLKYHQSRPFGWAVNTTNVFFGTVPDYGRAGGVLGMIDPKSNTIAWVLNGGGHGFVTAHSIIGLVADERFVYGTTSVRNGYGMPDTKGAAKVFKFEIATRTKIWESTPVRGAGALYSPKLIAGWLVVGDLEGLKVIDPATGKLVVSHRLTTANNSANRPGWANADVAQVGDGSKVVHSAAGTTTVVDFRKGTKAIIGSPQGKMRFGSRLTSTPTGRVFGFTDDTVLVELDLIPKKVPSRATNSSPGLTPKDLPTPAP